MIALLYIIVQSLFSFCFFMLAHPGTLVYFSANKNKLHDTLFYIRVVGTVPERSQWCEPVYAARLDCRPFAEFMDFSPLGVRW